MVVEYDVTVSDVIAFNSFHTRHSPALRRQFLISRLVLSLFTAAFAALVIYLLIRPESAVSYIGAVVAGLLIFVVYPQLAQRGRKNLLTKLMNEGKNLGVFGEHRLESTPDQLLIFAPSGSSHMSWPSVEEIVATNKYVFIYVSAMTALIVPARAFADRIAFDTFVHTAQQYQQAQSS